MKYLRLFMIKGKLVRYALIFVLLAFGNCTNHEDEHSFDPSLFDYQMESISKSYQGCEIGTPTCTYISLTWPLFKNDTGTVAMITSRVKEIIFEDQDKTPLVFCQDFIEEYRSFVESSLHEEEYDLAWYSESTVEILSIQKRVISLSIKQDNFQGGAHPNSYIYLLNFDPCSGKSISYDQLFSEESQKALLALLDHSLRKQKGLTKNESLNDAGFMLDDDELILSENFAFTDEGLLFIYNSYEIAPYVMGPISLILPYNLVIHLFDT